MRELKNLCIIFDKQKLSCYNITGNKGLVYSNIRGGFMDALKNIMQEEDECEIVPVKKRNQTTMNNTYMTSDLINTAIYDEKLMDNIMVGIAQNIWIEMDKQGMSARGLADLSGVNYSGLSKIFNNKARIGLSSVIKIAAALHVSPSEVFPYDVNKRKTNGQRFDEITKGMDTESINYLLDMAAGYSKLRHSRK